MEIFPSKNDRLFLYQPKFSLPGVLVEQRQEKMHKKVTDIVMSFSYGTCSHHVLSLPSLAQPLAVSRD